MEGSRLKIIEIVSVGDLVKVVDLDSATKQTIAQYFTRFTQSLAQRDSAQPSSAAPRPAQGAIIIQGLDGTKQLPLK